MEVDLSQESLSRPYDMTELTLTSQKYNVAEHFQKTDVGQHKRGEVICGQNPKCNLLDQNKAPFSSKGHEAQKS